MKVQLLQKILDQVKGQGVTQGLIVDVTGNATPLDFENGEISFIEDQYNLDSVIVIQHGEGTSFIDVEKVVRISI